MNLKVLFEVHEKNEEWFSAHLKELEPKYRGKFLAIKDQKVIAAEENLEKLLATLKEKGIDLDLVFIASIPPKDVALIL